MSKKQRTLVAAGAVVLRGTQEAREVLLVHRPAYDDWTLPKGRPEPDEDLPVVAVREVQEETGVRIRLLRRLGSRKYDVKGMPKVAHWYEARVVGEDTPVAEGDGEETDRAAWMGVEEALATMTHASEKEAVREAMTGQATHHTIILVRHGKAMDRKHWSGKDWKRPLSSRGRRQARRLAPLLQAYGVERLVASSSTRCVETLAPAGRLLGVKVEGIDALSEEAHKAHAEGAFAATEGLADWARTHPDRPLAICGHRPVLPTMREALGLENAPMLVAESVVTHRRPDGLIVQSAVIKSAF